MTELEKLLMRHEGFRSRVYKCTAGKSTVGFGRNLDDVGITEEEALLLLRNDILKVEQQLKAALPWTETIDRVRRDVLLNMAFQMGITGLLKFTSTLKAVKDHRWEDAASGMRNSLWAKQTPARANELAEMMRTGERLQDGN